MKNLFILCVAVLLASCGGGGSSGGNTIASPVVPAGDSVSGMCARQGSYFNTLSGTYKGFASEVVGSESYCEFEVSLKVNNDPEPFSNCEVSGTLSYSGTQLIADAARLSTCESRLDLPVTISQTIGFINPPNPLPLPASLIMKIDAPLPTFDSDGNRTRHPFISRTTLRLNQSYNLETDDFELLRSGEND